MAKKLRKADFTRPISSGLFFHPNICRFEKGYVQVETQEKTHMGHTAFVPSPQGNVEIARTVDREQFYHILSSVLCGKHLKNTQRPLPPLVVSRAKSAGAVGEAWLANLDNIVRNLKKCGIFPSEKHCPVVLMLLLPMQIRRKWRKVCAENRYAGKSRW